MQDISHWFIDSYDDTGALVEGSWRDKSVGHSRNASNVAKAMRDTLKNYVNSETGSVSRQHAHVTDAGIVLQNPINN